MSQNIFDHFFNSKRLLLSSCQKLTIPSQTRRLTTAETYFSLSKRELIQGKRTPQKRCTKDELAESLYAGPSRSLDLRKPYFCMEPHSHVIAVGFRRSQKPRGYCTSATIGSATQTSWLGDLHNSFIDGIRHRTIGSTIECLKRMTKPIPLMNTSLRNHVNST